MSAEALTLEPWLTSAGNACVAVSRRSCGRSGGV